jgi:hypothetical protein
MEREERQRVRETERHRDREDRETEGRRSSTHLAYQTFESSCGSSVNCLSNAFQSPALQSAVVNCFAEDWNALEKKLTELPQDDSNDWHGFNSFLKILSLQVRGEEKEVDPRGGIFWIF